jgi:hypothetical protein
MQTSSFTTTLSSAVPDVAMTLESSPQTQLGFKDVAMVPGQRLAVVASFSFDPSSADAVASNVSQLLAAITSQIPGLNADDVTISVNPNTGDLQVTVVSSASVSAPSSATTVLSMMQSSDFAAALSSAVPGVTMALDVGPQLTVSGPSSPPLPEGQQLAVVSSFSFDPSSADVVTDKIANLVGAITSQIPGLNADDVTISVNPNTGALQVTVLSSASVSASTVAAAMQTSSFTTALSSEAGVAMALDVVPQLTVSGPPPPPLLDGQQLAVVASFSFGGATADEVTDEIAKLVEAVASQIPNLSMDDVTVTVDPNTDALEISVVPGATVNPDTVVSAMKTSNFADAHNSIVP